MNEVEHNSVLILKTDYQNMINALKFYATESKYEYHEHPDGLEGRGDFPILQDGGERANKILKEMGVDV
jgi:hypothetical protein